MDGPKDPRIVDAPEAPEDLRTQEFKAARAIPLPRGAFESESPPPRESEVIAHAAAMIEVQRARQEHDALCRKLSAAEHKLHIVELLAEACPHGVPPELLRLALHYLDASRAT